MASFNFGLLELADGESGEAAVSVVVGKAKAEAAHAKKAAAAAAEAGGSSAGADKDNKAVLKNLYYYKLQHDNGIRNIEHELKRLRDVLIKLRGQEKQLNEIGEKGVHLIPLPEEQRSLRLMQLSEEQRKLRQQQKKLREQEAKLRPLRKEFYLEHGFPLVGANEEEEEPQPGSVEGFDNAVVDNVNGSCNGDGNGSVHSYHHGEPAVHADGPYVNYDDDRQGDDGYAYNNNGGRQGYPEVHNKKVQKWVKSNKPPSDAGTEADHKPEEKVTSDAGSEAEHKPVEKEQEEAGPTANADAAPVSVSENSSTTEGAAKSNNEQVHSRPFIKSKLSGSAKRKKKNARNKGGSVVDKEKKQDSSQTDVSEKTDKEQQAAYPVEEEKKTLAEYEKIREEKKKSLEDASRAEQRKVSAEEFKGLQLLEKKKLDNEEAVMKAEKVKVQNKAKEAEAAKESGKKEGDAKEADAVKTKKVVTVLPLKDLSFVPPRRQVIFEDGSTNGRGRFNGSGFQGRGRDNSSDNRAPAGRGGDNGRGSVQNEAGNYGNGGAQRGGYSGGRGGYGAPRADYSGGRDGYGAPRGDYSGGRGDGYGAPRGRGDGYNGRANGNGDGYHQGYEQQQQQGGGYYQSRAGNDSYYRPRGRGGYNGRNPPAPKPIVVEDPNVFPPLPASAPARAASAAPASAPAPAQS